MKRIASAFLLAAVLLTTLVLPVAADEVTDYTDLYVKEGLVIHCDAFDPTGLPSDGIWEGEKGSLTLVGNWQTGRTGMGIRYLYDDVDAFTANGIRFDGSALTDNYTVETVASPDGVRDMETEERYLADGASHVASYDSAFSFGPFKAVAYPGLHDVTDSLSLWYYYTEGDRFADVGEYLTWSNAFLAYDDGEVTSYSVAHQLGESKQDAVYRIYHGNMLSQAIAIDQEIFVPSKRASTAYKLFYGFPVTVYSVRVYDRLLSERERNQNHFADLCAYYGIDVSDFWMTLSEEEKTALTAETASLGFENEKKLCGILSRYVCDSLLCSAAAEVASRYGVDLLAAKAKNRLAEAEQALLALPNHDAVTAETAQAAIDAAVEGVPLAEKLLSFCGFLPCLREEPAFVASFAVDAGVLAVLEQSYTVSYGALAGLASAYTDPNSLTLDATANRKRYRAYETGDKASDFTMGVYWSQPYQNEAGYALDVVFRAYYTLTDKDGNTVTRYLDTAIAQDTAPSMLDAATYFVTQYDGEWEDVVRFNQNSLLRSVLTTCRIANIPVRGTEDEIRLYKLQDDLKKGLDTALTVSQVLISGEDDPTGEAGIWIKYLADYVEDDKGNRDERIRPAYLYFPSVEDPFTMTDSDMKAKGIYRTFCYIGSPDFEATDAFPAILCVHGGGGRAYVKYVQEAVNHGYAAIAVDTDGNHANISVHGDKGSFSADPLSFRKDSLSDPSRDIEEQWMYYVQRMLIYAHTALRSLDCVDESAVGITGISWGGLCTSIAICHDSRYAFAVPIYLSANMDETDSELWHVNDSFFGKGLWQDDDLLKEVQIPTMILNGEADPYASVNTSVRTYSMLKNGYINIRHGFSHSQQQGASAPEVYAFADYIISMDDRLTIFEDPPATTMGRSYVLKATLAPKLTNHTATLYYLTEPISYVGSSYATSTTRVAWQAVPLTMDEEGNIQVEIPDSACLYFITVSGYSKVEDKLPDLAGYPKHTGMISASTPMVCIGCPGVYD